MYYLDKDDELLQEWQQYCCGQCRMSKDKRIEYTDFWNRLRNGAISHKLDDLLYTGTVYRAVEIDKYDDYIFDNNYYSCSKDLDGIKNIIEKTKWLSNCIIIESEVINMIDYEKVLEQWYADYNPNHKFSDEHEVVCILDKNKSKQYKKNF